MTKPLVVQLVEAAHLAQVSVETLSCLMFHEEMPSEMTFYEVRTALHYANRVLTLLGQIRKEEDERKIAFVKGVYERAMETQRKRVDAYDDFFEAWVYGQYPGTFEDWLREHPIPE